MTNARLKPAPADGHGLTPRVVDDVYNALSAGKPVEAIVGLVLLKPVEHGEKLTAAGTTRWVRFEAAQLEPILDSNEIENARHQLKAAWDTRHGGQMLPLDFDGRSNDEQRRHLLGLVDEWASEQGLTATEVGERWRAQWGIDGDEPSPDGAFPHPDYRKAAPHHIKEFGYMVGVLADDNVAGTPEDDALANGTDVDEPDNVTPIDGKAAAAGPDR